jgi:hypothetical protein
MSHLRSARIGHSTAIVGICVSIAVASARGQTGRPSATALEMAAYRAIGAKHSDPSIRNADRLLTAMSNETILAHSSMAASTDQTGCGDEWSVVSTQTEGGLDYRYGDSNPAPVADPSLDHDPSDRELVFLASTAIECAQPRPPQTSGLFGTIRSVWRVSAATFATGLGGDCERSTPTPSLLSCRDSLA